MVPTAPRPDSVLDTTDDITGKTNDILDNTATPDKTDTLNRPNDIVWIGPIYATKMGTTMEPLMDAISGALRGWYTRDRLLVELH